MKRPLFIYSFIFAIIGVTVAYFLAGKNEDVNARYSLPVAPRSQDEQTVIDVYKNSNEAVAFITTITITFDMFSGIQPEEGTGSGVVIDTEKGMVLTNLHVIENAKQVEVSLANGGVFEAKLVGIDRDSDIAILRLVDPPDGLVRIPFGDSSALEIGQQVIAIGNPFGLNRTLTTGNISNLNRTIRRPDGTFMKGLIQTDASINVGNSGGPLLDKAGRIIGINTAILSRSGDSAGISFAVPINQIKRILPELIATGKVLKPDLGWVLIDTDQGPMVHQIIPGGPADLAKIKPIMRRVEGAFITGFVRDLDRADLITAINGVAVATKDQIDDIISQSGGATSVKVELAQGRRNGPSRVVTIDPILR